MKVLHTLDSLNRGGAETLGLDICRNARNSGLEITFVATGGGDLEEDFERSGIEYIRLQRRLPLDLKIIAKLRRIILERGIQVAHANQAVEALHIYFATLGTPAKCVLSFHGYVRDTKNLTVLKFLAPRMDANVAVSGAFLEWVRSEARLDITKKFSVIYNGVDPGRLQHSNGSNQLRTELGLSSEHILLGMVANFNAWKDQLTVCRALPDFFGRVPEAHFAFVGARSMATPDLYDECVSYCQQQNIADRVHFLGKRTDVAEVLSSLDIFVLSSLVEGLPVALIEAMMMGVPSVVSDISPSREVSDNGRYACMFSTGDAVDLARTLHKMVAEPNERRQRAQEARAMAMEKFSIQAHIQSLASLYSRLVDR
jgi:glycosyltransferase involved in cell wall biosynthesis